MSALIHKAWFALWRGEKPGLGAVIVNGGLLLGAVPLFLAAIALFLALEPGR